MTTSDFVLFPMAVQRSKQYFMDPVDMFYSMDVYGHTDLSRLPHSYFDTHMFESELKNPNFSTPTTPPSAYSTEPQVPTGSAASGPSIASASSSAMGSPYSGTAHAFQENWVNTNNGLGLPGVVMNDLFSQEYMGNTMDMDMLYQEKFPDSYVGMWSPIMLEQSQILTDTDPSLIQPVQQGPGLTPTISYPEHSNSYSNLPHNYLVPSPATSPHPYNDIAERHPSPRSHPAQHAGPSPLMVPQSQSRPVSLYDRRSSISSIRSRHSQHSPALSSIDPDDETKEKGQCPHPECGRVFKDLKAHMLTHQSERPEKCPILTCEYHTKGFARKYDKNRHTLTHYKGTMVCGFCPGPGSPAEKSFNRADVFKRHLTSVHGVEQTPPNCRKRSPSASTKKGTNYSSDATGKCSTCSATFSNAQDFYEHLDDCVLSVVQQEERSEAINQQRLAEVAGDEEVKKTMEKHQLDVSDPADTFNDYDELNNDDSHDLSNWRAGHSGLKSTKGNGIPSSRSIIGSGNAISKTKPHRAIATRRRNNRGNYPQSWGCPSSSIKTKKRVLCVFDGQRRLWKDEMMLNNEFEVRVRLPRRVEDDRDAYVTDLDIETLNRAEGVLGATDEERGPCIGGPASYIMGQPAMPLPEIGQMHDDEISINELMA
jgi:hypothetical protein